MDYSEMKDIASENGLQFVETTSERSGYPRYVKGALIGFVDFQQAEEVAKKHGLDIEVIEKHDGWNLWYRTGNWANSPLKISEEDLGDDFRFFKAEDWEDFYEDEVRPFIADCADWDELDAFISDMRRLDEEIENLDADSNDVVVACNGKYYDTIDTKPMQFSWDSKTTAIALVCND